jgi:hypothetical protein
MKVILLILITSLISSLAIGEERLCNFKKTEVKNLSMSESDFNTNSYTLSIEFLESLPNSMLNSKNIKEYALSPNTWISYINSLKIVKGYNLKKQALFSPSQKNIEKFCQFLKIEGKYAD